MTKVDLDQPMSLDFEAAVEKIYSSYKFAFQSAWRDGRLFIDDNGDLSGDFKGILDENAKAMLDPLASAVKNWMPRKLPEYANSGEGVLAWQESAGGSMGPHLILRQGNDYVGHFYVDATDGIDAENILMEMATAANERRT